MPKSVKCFHGWWSYLKLALPSVGACCLEWWLYEGLILIAGWFPNADVAVAAMGVGFNTTALTYTISQGVGGRLCFDCRRTRGNHVCVSQQRSPTVLSCSAANMWAYSYPIGSRLHLGKP